MRPVVTSLALALWLAPVLLGGCEGKPGPRAVADDPTDVFVDGLTDDEVAQFRRGDKLLDKLFAEPDGIGPLYVEASCRSCHGGDARGPGRVDRMAIAGTDGDTQASQASLLPFGTVLRNRTAAGATHPIVAPTGTPGLFLSSRFGPALFARGRIEGVADADILAEEAHQSNVGIVSGRANVMDDGSVGRFGVKARISTLERFVADALHGDMGLTSSIFPTELPNPDGLTDDLKPGVDIADATIEDMAGYVRTLAMPRRTGLTSRGFELMAETGCLDCHVNTYQTRSDFAVGALAGIAADVYSDLLLHDLGVGDSDGITDVGASGREWKTAPLVGLRFQRSYMHDGRSKTVEDAIMAHDGEGSEASPSIQKFSALHDSERQMLLEYLETL